MTFSGDKLLGGPQAGIIVGRADAVAAIARHPFARAMRADKMTLAALQQTALVYLSGDATSIPLWRMATAPLEQLRTRAERDRRRPSRAPRSSTPRRPPGAGRSRGSRSRRSASRSRPSAAGTALATLRSHGVIARTAAGTVVCDLRSVDPDADPVVAAALAAS